MISNYLFIGYLVPVSNYTPKLSFTELEELSERLRALGHPIRLGIVEFLGAMKEANVTAIHEGLEIEQATASHHLRILRTANIVTVQRVGKSSVYRLFDQSYEQLIPLLT